MTERSLYAGQITFVKLPSYTRYAASLLRLKTLPLLSNDGSTAYLHSYLRSLLTYPEHTGGDEFLDLGPDARILHVVL